MKPTTKLLRPSRAVTPGSVRASPPSRERDVLYARRRTLEADRAAVKAAAAAIPKRLDDLIATIRRDSQDRPAAIAGSVVIRVLGAMREDRRPVPLPKLRVTLVGSDKVTSRARTDVTGLAILPVPHDTPIEPAEPAESAEPARPAREARRELATYRLTITASDGTEIAHAEADPSRTHVLVLGDVKGLEGHAALGRGWLAALDRAAAQRDAIAKRAAVELAEVEQRTTTRLAAIAKRLDMHHEQ